jgi:hypothetical protein
VFWLNRTSSLGEPVMGNTGHESSGVEAVSGLSIDPRSTRRHCALGIVHGVPSVDGDSDRPPLKLWAVWKPFGSWITCSVEDAMIPGGS